jgi:ATP-dependent Clp protease ATP-binding subunit ClpA
VRIVPELQHELRLARTRDEKARANFVSSLRSFVHDQMARGLRRVYEHEVAPRLEAELGRAARDGAEVHQALRSNEYFRFYSSLRVTGQDMVYQVVAPAIERERAGIAARARDCAAVSRCRAR